VHGVSVKDLIGRYFKEVLPKYSQQEQQNRHKRLIWWSDELGSLDIGEFNSAVISEKVNKLKVAPATVDKYLKNLSHMCTIAVKSWDLLEYNPLNKVKTPRLPLGRVRYLSDEERSKLLKACQKSKEKLLYICVTLALGTGLRLGELMGLKWVDVDFADRSITIKNKQKNSQRRVPLEGHGLALLRGYNNVRRKDAELLFPSKQADKPVDLRKAFQAALNLVHITDFKWSDLRHCKAIQLAMAGSTLPQIAEVLGYTSLTMAKRYEHLSQERVTNVVHSLIKKIY
jgi:integrase